MTMDDLTKQIEETERLITVYRNANEVIVGTPDQIYARRGLINRITLTAGEIGDAIVDILERRLAAMRTELQELGAFHFSPSSNENAGKAREGGTNRGDVDHRRLVGRSDATADC